MWAEEKRRERVRGDRGAQRSALTILRSSCRHFLEQRSIATPGKDCFYDTFEKRFHFSCWLGESIEISSSSSTSPSTFTSLSISLLWKPTHSPLSPCNLMWTSSSPVFPLNILQARPEADNLIPPRRPSSARAHRLPPSSSSSSSLVAPSSVPFDVPLSHSYTIISPNRLIFFDPTSLNARALLAEVVVRPLLVELKNGC